jgi:hypothetical protein
MTALLISWRHHRRWAALSSEEKEELSLLPSSHSSSSSLHLGNACKGGKTIIVINVLMQ